MEAKVFHKEERLYTLLMVDPGRTLSLATSPDAQQTYPTSLFTRSRPLSIGSCSSLLRLRSQLMH